MSALKQVLVFCLAVVLAGFALLSWAPAQAQGPLPRFEPVAEGEDFPVAVSGPRYERGYLLVAQQAEEPDTLVLRLPVVRIAALDPEPGLAPVLFLPGGPGTGSLSAARFPGAYPWTQNRDFIVMGRRGTRNAQPSLQCPEIGPALAAIGDSAQAQLFAALDACRSQLEAEGVVLEAYNSDASASDIEALRQVLGEDQLALFALSYGTRLALTYARDYPGRVEAMVLDSPLPHSAKYDDAYPRIWKPHCEGLPPYARPIRNAHRPILTWSSASSRRSPWRRVCVTTAKPRRLASSGSRPQRRSSALQTSPVRPSAWSGPYVGSPPAELQVACLILIGACAYPFGAAKRSRFLSAPMGLLKDGSAVLTVRSSSPPPASAGALIRARPPASRRR
jgi:pimeloyl-ACP methyl ester carboxylesterase